MTETHKQTVVAVSGGFDPLHIGHVRMFKRAKELGDKLVVIINNDNWLRTKKGYVFMTEQQRKEIIAAIKWVDEVVISEHPENPTDMSVSNELLKLKPDIFAQGGDRKPDATPIPGSEVDVCEKMGCEIVYNVGDGGKIQSSSELVAKSMEQLQQNGKTHN